jgi:feruloyl esterase
LFQNPSWDYHTLDFDKDIAAAEKIADPIMNAKDPSKLKALFARGGKLLMYHGWNDRAITPLSSVDYYTRAVAANGGREKTDSLVRLFMVPGMGHCTGGEGPFQFDKVGPLAAWVETGKAPEQIIASHVDEQGKVDRTRPLCPYPKMAKYKGSGSIDEAANFVCAMP